MWMLRNGCYVYLMIVELSAAYEDNVPTKKIGRLGNPIQKGHKAWFYVVSGHLSLFKQECCSQRAVRVFVNGLFKCWCGCYYCGTLIRHHSLSH